MGDDDITAKMELIHTVMTAVDEKRVTHESVDNISICDICGTDFKNIPGKENMAFVRISIHNSTNGDSGQALHMPEMCYIAGNLHPTHFGVYYCPAKRKYEPRDPNWEVQGE